MRQHRLIPLPILVAALGLAGCGQLLAPPTDSAPPSSAPAEDAPSVVDLVDVTIAAGDKALTSRGYIAAVTHNTTTYWWHPAGSCVRVVIADDHYKVVEPVSASDCGR